MTTGRNLSRADARERANLIEVTAYEIHLDLTDGVGGPGSGTFTSTTTVRFDCAQPGSATVIDLAAVDIIEATCNGVAVPTAGWSSEHGLPLAGLAATNELRVVAACGYVTGGRGMHRSVDPADGQIYLYTSFEPAAAHHVFACFDQPDLKASIAWQVRIPQGWRAVSNMPSVGTDPDDSGAITVRFATSPRMSTYLAAVCAGPFAEVRDASGGWDLGIFCRPSLLGHLDAEEIFDLTRRGMAFFTEQFGQPYPLPKYDHVAAPDYQGAMENFGCIVFNERLLVFRSAPTEWDRYLRAMIILHELAHMWFGDLVTMRWWDDLWLNEAFATWAAFWCLAEATDLPDPWAIFIIQHKSAGIKADQLSSTHPIGADIADVEATETNFDAITYRKGASVLKQLAAYVGIEAFTTALRAYFAEHAWGNATFDDLVRALAAASGRPVAEFAARWLRTASVNTLRPRLSLDDQGRYREVAVVQEAPSAHPTLRTHRIAVGLYDLDGSRLVRRERVEVEVAGEHTEIPALRGVAAADVLLVNDDDLTYAKVRFDDASLRCVLDHVQALPSTLARAISWAAVADMVNDAEMPTRDFITLVCNALPHEANIGLVTSVLTETTRALNYFADPGWASTGWANLATTCRDAAYAARPGSSAQLTWVRAFASAARTLEDLVCLKAWYAGTDLPAGLRLDPDLRWLVLQGLVASGAAGQDEVEREASADRSVGGRREAALARALIPSVEAKRQAWQAAVHGIDEPIDVRVAAITGYAHPAHTGFTAAHVGSYLSTVDTIWNEQGSEVGRNFATMAFPAAHVSAETIAALDAWRAAPGHPPSLVRLVTDGQDQLVRALAGRACDRDVTRWRTSS